MSPVLPTTLQGLIPTGTDTFCVALTKTIKFYIQFYRWYSYAYDGVGAFNPSFATDLCTVLNNCE